MEETRTERIRRSSSRSGRTGKKKKNQLPVGIVLIIAAVLITLFLMSKSSGKIPFYWITGIIFGYILQRSRFCFTASLRDPFLTGSTSLTRAVLTAFAVTTIGFAAIKYGAYLKGLPIPGQSYIHPVSLATAGGAFLFGIGMVIAGGCASGTLMRVGEGFIMQMLVLVFFVIGSLWGAHDFEWWRGTHNPEATQLNAFLQGKAIFLPDIFGWAGALIIQFIIIGLLWIAADKWEHRKEPKE